MNEVDARVRGRETTRETKWFFAQSPHCRFPALSFQARFPVQRLHGRYPAGCFYLPVVAGRWGPMKDLGGHPWRLPFRPRSLPLFWLVFLPRCYFLLESEASTKPGASTSPFGCSVLAVRSMCI
ncbi:hypothetical protein DPEC_G00039370 [Dallia pectoralis]|uniref:Uncharacterized protein n=1 Tax=Dallia pectoralis TaxID=75939 RepID=A0ACC2HF51_DALPE|nr:hypothetical protein DPEC_G00039370 [Dallia pectoralis]